MKNPQKKTVSITLPLKLYKGLERLSKKEGLTVPGYIRQLLRRFMWYVENAPEALTDHWEEP